MKEETMDVKNVHRKLKMNSNFYDTNKSVMKTKIAIRTMPLGRKYKK